MRLQTLRGLLPLALAACGSGSPHDTAAPAADADVIVIGGGLAGMTAARAAREAGASVILVERQPELGGSARFAGSWLAAGTEAQAALGVEDSPEQALAEWAEATGGDPDDPVVEAFLEASAGALAEAVALSGEPVSAVTADADCGTTARKHWVDAADLAGTLAAAVDAPWTGWTATALDLEASPLGVTVEPTAGGEARVLHAPAVVVAAGGFARNLDAVLAQDPWLADADPVPEAAPANTGAWLSLADGLAWQNEGRYGIYVHSTPDFRPGFEGEALLVLGTERSLIVDASGRRVADESLSLTFDLAPVLAELDDPRLFALFPASVWPDVRATVPGYDWADPAEPEHLSGGELVDAGAAWFFDDLDRAAEVLGIDGATLAATVARYDELAHAGEDADMGKAPEDLVPFDDDRLGVVPLVPGIAKSFTGLSVDERARVRDAAGAVVPGLYAAGESVGMLGTPAVGTGFAGSATAVFWLGEVAGAEAAAFAAE